MWSKQYYKNMQNLGSTYNLYVQKTLQNLECMRKLWTVVFGSKAVSF